MFILHTLGWEVTHKMQSPLPDASKCIDFFEANEDLIPSSQIKFCYQTQDTAQIPTAHAKASQRE